MAAAVTPAANDSPRPRSLRDRSPHPYNTRGTRPSGLTISENRTDTTTDRTPSRRSSVPTATASESGTEADDEKPQWLKALPPATHRPRKGLKGSATPLLTPAQLDNQGKRFSQALLDNATTARLKALAEERAKFQQRQRAERVRRLCEASLLGLTGLIVGYGCRIWRAHVLWHLVLVLSQVGSIAALIAFYPLRLVSVEHQDGHVHIWSRFRIPPSFDPANVLYPTFLPVLVAFSLSPQTPDLVIPALVLGLASLPGRLFPDWSHRAVLNPLHWAVSLVPVFCARLIGFAFRTFPDRLSLLQPPELFGVPGAEELVCLFPLHRTLLASVHYISTTSLLPAEKQLLCTSLIMLLHFASSPQSHILRSVLWVGGFGVFAASIHLLRWNVSLSRIPTWRLIPSRKPQTYKSPFVRLVQDGLYEIEAAFGRCPRPDYPVDSGSDEPNFAVPPRELGEHRLGAMSDDSTAQDHNQSHSAHGDSHEKENGMLTLKRRNTFATLDKTSIESRRNDDSIGTRSHRRRRDWRLRLDSSQITIRKYVYSGTWFACVLALVAGPVRLDVARHALSTAEPVLWILDYMFGEVPVRQLLDVVANGPTGVATFMADATDLLLHYKSVPVLRAVVGQGNVRILFIVYWILVLAFGLLAQTLLAKHIEIDTRRKIFHGVLVAMLLPTIFIDPCLCGLALTLSLGIISILELVRAGQLWPLGAPLSQFLAPYVDGRDLRGPIVISHFFLLIGCAVPLWLSLATFDRSETGLWPGWELQDDRREVAMISGVVCVGMGDAAASLFGRRYGRRKWPWIGGKSLEGSAAFTVAVSIGLLGSKAWMQVGAWNGGGPVTSEGFGYIQPSWAMDCVKAVLAAAGASFLEAVLTGANDNVVVPIALWLLVRGLHL